MVNLYHIYFGTIDSEVRNLMDFFAANLAGSQIYSTMSAYYMVCGIISCSHLLSSCHPQVSPTTGLRTYVSNKIAFQKSVVYSPQSKDSFSDKDMIDVIKSLLNSGL
jgi:hypothetical protein